MIVGDLCCSVARCKQFGNHALEQQVDEEEIAGLLGHAVAVIDALANEPEDVVAGTEHPLALLLYEGVFAVGEVVAD